MGQVMDDTENKSLASDTIYVKQSDSMETWFSLATGVSRWLDYTH